MHPVVAGFAPLANGCESGMRGLARRSRCGIAVCGDHCGDRSRPAASPCLTTGSLGLGPPRAGESFGHEIHRCIAALTRLLTAGRFSIRQDLCGGVTPPHAFGPRRTREACGVRGQRVPVHALAGTAVRRCSMCRTWPCARAANRPCLQRYLTVQWTERTAAEWEEALRPQGSRAVAGALRAVLPDRLVAVLLDAREGGRDAVARGAASRRAR
jgi:hypothetical protein